MFRNDFAILLLTHGRAEHIVTIKALERAGYTGKLYIVIDDEDEQEPIYRQKYGDKVIRFCKKEIDAWTDRGDNRAEDKRAILWARNASFEIAKKLGLTYFMMLEDDQPWIATKSTNERREFLHQVHIRHFEDFLNLGIRFLDATGAKTICFGQGGDLIGGLKGGVERAFVKYKAMNSFICRADNPIRFAGRFNEDVTWYCRGWLTGHEMYSIMPIIFGQIATQTNKGGMSEAYKGIGTYVKSLMSALYAPACVKVSILKGNHWDRVHHKVNWNHTKPCILRENWKKK